MDRNDGCVERLVDRAALLVGVALMALGQFQPWEMVNPQAVFALGIGLATVPSYTAFRRFHAMLAQREKGRT